MDVLSLPTILSFLHAHCSDHFNKIANDTDHPLNSRIIIKNNRTPAHKAEIDKYRPAKCRTQGLKSTHTYPYTVWVRKKSVCMIKKSQISDFDYVWSKVRRAGEIFVSLRMALWGAHTVLRTIPPPDPPMRRPARARAWNRCMLEAVPSWKRA